jgi:beta-1,4-N-acetylglucosaminyltransferase
MIFVTVGSTEFDALVREMDKLAKGSEEKVVCQIGPKGTYIPKKCKNFRTKLDISSEMEKAEVVITHGGAATIFEALSMGKRVIAVCNPRMKKGHQEDIVDVLASEGLIIKGQLGKLKKAIESKKQLTPYEKPECRIHKKIKV